MRFTHLTPIALVALLTTSCMSPPIHEQAGPAGGDHILEELEADVRASGPVESPRRGLIDAPGTSRRLPPPPAASRATTAPASAPTTAPTPYTTSPAAAPPGSARSYIERHQQR